jgi:hypothetical protein
MSRICRLLLLASMAPLAFGENTATSTMVLVSVPGNKWALSIAEPNVIVETKELYEDGKNVRLMAYAPDSGILMSAFIEKRPSAGTPQQCRDFYWTTAQKSPLSKEKVRLFERWQMACVEYIVPEHIQMKIQQKNINAYMTRENYWIDVHLSKVNFTESDEKLFESILGNIAIVPRPTDGKVTVNYKAGGNRVMQVSMPAGWTDEAWATEGRSKLYDLKLSPADVRSGKVFVTFVIDWKEADSGDATHRARSLLEKAGQDSLKQAVETSLAIRQFKASSGTGFSYTLTDKAPKPGEFKYMTQGTCPVGSSLALFTVLTSEKDSSVVTNTIEMVAGITER